jgi:hypothetical protein
VNAIRIRWPDAALSPNGRVHYMVKHRAVRKYRELARYLGLGQKRLQNPVCALLPLTAVKRRRDLDNVLAALKPAFDGVTDAGWWSDDSAITEHHVLPEIHHPLWGENGILLMACERDELPTMQAAVARLRDGAAAGAPNEAVGALLAASSSSSPRSRTM